MAEDNSDSVIAGENKACRLCEFKKYYDDISIAIIILDADKKIIYANDEMKKLSGLDDKAIIGATAGGILGCINSFKDPRGCGYSDNCPSCPLFKAINEVFQSKRPQKNIEFNPVILINGANAIRSFIFTAAPAGAPAGNNPLLCFNDITKIKTIERESLENKDRLGLVFKMSPDAIIITRADDGLIINANEGLCELSGYSQEEIKGKTTFELNFFEAADREKIVNSITKDGYCNNIEHVFTVKNGRKLTCLLSARIIDIDETKHIMSVVRDITDRKTYEKAIIEARKAAEDASGAKSQFLANMSHEIRTPLNSIIGYTDLLSLDINISGEPKEFIDSINYSARSLLMIINDILDLSKIEAGKLELEETMIDLFKLLEQTVNVFKVSASGKTLDLILSIDPATPRYIKADQTRLRQVLINLLSNAVKFTEAGEVKLGVSFVPASSGVGPGAFTFIVRDTGIGIDENEKKLLFKAFSQGDASVTRKFGGTGLGLIISSKLVKKMGGEIEFKSRKGIGSEFYFTIFKEFEYDLKDGNNTDYNNKPVVAGRKSFGAGPDDFVEGVALSGREAVSDKEKAGVFDSDGGSAEAGGARSGPVILITEDSPMNMKLFSSIFKKLASTAVIICADDGAAALELYKERRPDIVFMDIQMPVMDGYEATRKIREYEKKLAAGKKAVIIAVTASAVKGEEEKCLQAGMDRFMSKPLDYKALKDIIEKYAEKK
jgi:PAS domain S-box-containing protein